MYSETILQFVSLITIHGSSKNMKTKKNLQICAKFINNFESQNVENDRVKKNIGTACTCKDTTSEFKNRCFLA